MAIQNNQIITGPELKKTFIENVLNPIFSNTYHNQNIPRLWGTSWRGQRGETLAYKDIEAVPSNNLKNYNDEYQTMLNMFNDNVTDQTLRADYIYNSIVYIMKRATTIRKFKSYWYKQVQGNMQYVTESGGKAIFKESLPGLPGYSAQFNQARYGGERSTNTGDQYINLEGFSHEDLINRSNVLNFYNRLYQQWQRLYENTITYKFYTCHQNCHHECHSSRGRR